MRRVADGRDLGTQGPTGAGAAADGTKPVEALTVEGWSPDYGSPIDTEREEVPAEEVDAGAELAEGEWRPLEPGEGASRPRIVYFVDGVRRIEARVWMSGEGEPRLGICASYAAGVVRCDGKADIVSSQVRRGFFGRSGVPDLVTQAGRFAACPVAEDDLQQLVNGIQERMGRLEIEVAEAARTEVGEPTDSDTLVVVDGPLRGRQRIPGAVGYVKSHRVHYLSGRLRDMVASLAPGQRTPVFLIQTTWTRYSWYLRLAEAEGHPWAGIVRCEAWPNSGLGVVTDTADRTAATLPRFASEPHREERAPQNLYPIAGLETRLRHLLGDRAIVYRSLREAAAGYRS